MNNTIDQQFVEYIVKSLVGNPDAVEIKRTIDEKGVLLELTVDPQDLGRVIGKRGAGAQALRTLLRALGTKNDARYNLKIVDNGEPRPERHYEDRREEASTEPEQTGSAVADVEADQTPETHEQPAEEPEQTAQSEEPVVESTQEDTHGENEPSLADKTRRELADLDDLDV